MKKKLLVVFGALLSLSLASCGNNENVENKPTPPVVDENKPDIKPDTTIKEDYTVKTTCDAGKFDKESYLFSTVDKNSEYFELVGPKLTIDITSDYWGYVTGYDQNFKLISENQDVIPDSALSLKEVHAKNSNVIVGFEINLDRTKINVGNTHVKVLIKPTNGSTSAERVELCAPVEVKEYGTITQVVNDVDFKLDLTTLSPDLLTKELSFIAYDDDHIYGCDNIKRKATKITSLDEVLTVKLPFSHNMNFFLEYKENGNSELIQLNIESDASYSIVNGYFNFTKAPTSPIKVTLKNK